MQIFAVWGVLILGAITPGGYIDGLTGLDTSWTRGYTIQDKIVLFVSRKEVIWFR